MAINLSQKFLDPQICGVGSGGKLSPKFVNQWREKGAIILQDLFPECLVQKLRKDVVALDKDAKISGTSFGTESTLTFPSDSDFLNQTTVHPNLLSLVRQLLQTDEIRLTQSEAWGKVGIKGEEWVKRKPRESHDQRIHCDYPNHTLVHPSDWSSPDAVSFILYLSDHQDCEGGTALVLKNGDDDAAYKGPLTKTPGVTGPWINDRTMAEDKYRETKPDIFKFRKRLYDREVRVRYKPGTLLVYRQDVWHRGTRVKPGSKRFVMNITYRRKDAEWIGHWHPGYARKNYKIAWPKRGLEKFIAGLSPNQRSVLGFPKPGHRYWNQYTIAAVEARYSEFGMNMAPYKEALKLRIDKAKEVERGHSTINSEIVSHKLSLTSKL
mmetsp:Transcript_11444/g.17109  ORF Transcript_11444/g.17109 Transcript_11444/m.17109 type:complete len:380 (-) Transcript_11444:207-1346(-)|eukprot:CAMPEP_0167740362 /NCGR_PEP_ID=MMETSP0110_2-20121227/232_1 /TAXON_ID=629695 /ORGANISM="Gymnochlora sp., Strain CCMP2014" /LENGTH=379 /DNA_ID=CAMNT_0007624241 /DNA_START=117 /DNA_END=1256 /DNA_ORIENTATION=+